MPFGSPTLSTVVVALVFVNVPVPEIMPVPQLRVPLLVSVPFTVILAASDKVAPELMVNVRLVATVNTLFNVKEAGEISAQLKLVPVRVPAENVNVLEVPVKFRVEKAVAPVC